MKMMVRSFFILYYVYPGITINLLACFASGSIAVISGSTTAGVLAVILSATLLVNSLRLGSESAYLHPVPSAPGQGLVMNLRGPFVSVKGREADLGDRPEGVDLTVSVILHNIGQDKIDGLLINLSSDSANLTGNTASSTPLDLDSGEVATVEITLRPRGPLTREGRVTIRVGNGDGGLRSTLLVRSILNRSEAEPVTATVSRWRYGYHAAVAWRADIDGFDNLSNEETLLPSLDISRHFGIPPSIFISGRLCLDFEEWRSWATNLPGKFDGPITRKRFSSWLEFLGMIRAADDLEYPMSGVEGLAGQIGNHMYYHYWSAYGYDASADTGWRANVSPGSCSHGWMSAGEDTGEYGEILENILVNNDRLRGFFGKAPRTWSAPADRAHRDYPRALEEAGLLGSSEAVEQSSRLSRALAPYRPDMGECRPHHPPGSRIVETGAYTRRFDPHTLTQLLSLKRSVRRAMNRGTQVTFLWHPHLRLHERFFGPQSSLAHFPEFLRFLVKDSGSSCWITTHYNITRYWEDVLCPEHRVVHAEVLDGKVVIRNTSDRKIAGVPIDIEYGKGKGSCQLVDLGPGSSVTLG